MEPEPNPAIETVPAQARAAGGRAPVAIAVVAIAAVAIAGYLTWVSVRQSATPAGCGPDSGCARVLASRWSRWFDVPVGAPAALLYLGVVVAALVAWRAELPSRRRGAWAALLILSTMAAGAAAWFLALQFAVLRAFCPWCLALHACGLVVFALAWTGRPRRARTFGDIAGAPAPGPGATAGDAPRPAGLVLAGLLGVGVLVAGQWMSRPAKKQMADNPLPGVAVFPSDHPIVGSPDARHVVVLLADYTCPHCRTLHHQMDAALARYGREQLAVAVAPVPLNKDCNDAIQFTEERMREACELARLALAVWAADPAKYPAMDGWLFEPEWPRSAADARAHAASLVGEAALATALADPRVGRRIAGNVELYKAAGKGRLPKMLLPGRVTEGEADDAEALFALLEKHLALAPAATRPTSR
jgi:uncharacterized membrane protein/protein-disulfide isomerase